MGSRSRTTRSGSSWLTTADAGICGSISRAARFPEGDGAHAEASRHLPKRFVFWAVDTVRAVPWIGPAPIAWLEDRTFALRDEARQLAFKLHGGDDADTGARRRVGGEGADRGRAGRIAVAWPRGWPPAKVDEHLEESASRGRGEWALPKLPWTKKLATADAATPPRASCERSCAPILTGPTATVLLVAMDTRQLDLDMEAGVEDPKPLTGPHGPGRLPRDPRIYQRVVAAFNGAFKTEHGNYGMMVHKRVLLPPQPSAASVVVLDDGRAGLGTWPREHEHRRPAGVPDEADRLLSPESRRSRRRRRGEPDEARMWGFTLPGKGAQTERTGSASRRRAT